MKIRYKICLGLLFSTLFGVSKAEVRFNAKIIFPLSIELNKISIEYHNGLQIIPYKISTQSHIIEISDVYYSQYPVLIITYNTNDNIVTYPERYFLEKKSELTYFGNSKNNLDSVKLIRAYKVKDMGENQFDLFAKKELDNLTSFLFVNAKYINDSSLIFQKFIELDVAVQKKKLKFIQVNNKLYYSLWVFKEEFVSNIEYNADSLQQIYKQFFSTKFSNTFEAKLIVSVLNGRLNSFKDKTAPLFSARDFNGNKVELLKFRGEKYVILNFWASWCQPCIAEMPILDSINRCYSKKNVTIISVSQDRNRKKCLNAIQRFQMNWINIINDPIVNSAYGNNPALPQVYLINKEGKIIYSRTDDKDYDLKKLYSIVEGL
ncbi:MAG: TlpA family protein disulfide reductase [Chitinophagaceae bacterium]|nr:TlpA family protein disulfide reductase [Chitinophagaceae bacterium]